MSLQPRERWGARWRRSPLPYLILALALASWFFLRVASPLIEGSTAPVGQTYGPVRTDDPPGTQRDATGKVIKVRVGNQHLAVH